MYPTVMTFDSPEGKKAFENIVGNEENDGSYCLFCCLRKL